MVGSSAEKAHSSSVGKNWLMTGFCRGKRDRPWDSKLWQQNGDEHECRPHVEIVDGLGHVQLVQDADDDGGGREESEQEEKEEVDHYVAQVPRNASNVEILPAGGGKQEKREGYTQMKQEDKKLYLIIARKL